MKARFTVDVVEMMMRMQENVVDCKRRVNVEGANGMDEENWPCERLLNLRKAYPPVTRLVFLMA